MIFQFSSEQRSGASIEAKIIKKIENGLNRGEKVCDGRLRVLSVRYVDLATNQVKAQLVYL